MKFGVLGTGMVGEAISSKLVALGHDVMMGSRSDQNQKALDWVSKHHGAQIGIFSDAAAFGEVIFNCTKGEASLSALKLAGAENLKDKILIDVANPLDFSHGMPPSLTVCNTDSLAEQIQGAFPEVKVVKTLNTVNCQIMVDPNLISGEHDIFLSGNDEDAKEEVRVLLRDQFGWKNIIDLGDISTARGTEQLLPLWVRLWGTLGNANFNFHVAR